MLTLSLWSLWTFKPGWTNFIDCDSVAAIMETGTCWPPGKWNHVILGEKLHMMSGWTFCDSEAVCLCDWLWRLGRGLPIKLSNVVSWSSHNDINDRTAATHKWLSEECLRYTGSCESLHLWQLIADFTSHRVSQLLWNFWFQNLFQAKWMWSEHLIWETPKLILDPIRLET